MLQAPVTHLSAPRIEFPHISWNTYVSFADEVGESSSTRLIYREGMLTFVTKSRRHGWFAERLSDSVREVAMAQRIKWEDLGSTTLRRADLKVGLEGDKAFYLGANAELMLGPKNVDLSVDPAPDLAIEVELTHPADEAMRVYAQLGVPEVWRFDANADRLEFHMLSGADYSVTDRSRALPSLTAAFVVEQLRQAESLGASRWSEQLRTWAQSLPTAA